MFFPLFNFQIKAQRAPVLQWPFSLLPLEFSVVVVAALLNTVAPVTWWQVHSSKSAVTAHSSWILNDFHILKASESRLLTVFREADWFLSYYIIPTIEQVHLVSVFALKFTDYYVQNVDLKFNKTIVLLVVIQFPSQVRLSFLSANLRCNVPLPVTVIYSSQASWITALEEKGGRNVCQHMSWKWLALFLTEEVLLRQLFLS